MNPPILEAWLPPRPGTRTAPLTSLPTVGEMKGREQMWPSPSFMPRGDHHCLGPPPGCTQLETPPLLAGKLILGPPPTLYSFAHLPKGRAQKEGEEAGGRAGRRRQQAGMGAWVQPWNPHLLHPPCPAFPALDLPLPLTGDAVRVSRFLGFIFPLLCRSQRTIVSSH